MKNSWQRRMRWMLLALTVSACLATTLSGCANSAKIECEKPLSLPAEMSAPQSPGAKVYSEKASSYLEKVEKYFAETPRFTTQR